MKASFILCMVLAMLLACQKDKGSDGSTTEQSTTPKAVDVSAFVGNYTCSCTSYPDGLYPPADTFVRVFSIDSSSFDRSSNCIDHPNDCLIDGYHYRNYIYFKDQHAAYRYSSTHGLIQNIRLEHDSLIYHERSGEMNWQTIDCRGKRQH